MRLRGLSCLLLLASCAAPGAPPAGRPAPQGEATHAVTATAAARPRPAPPATERIRAPRPATVAVAVATLWETPDAARPIDAPALANPVRYTAWLAAMSTAQRRALGPTRVRSSVLYAERVVVTRVSGDWAHVVVPSQRSPLDRRGYPGWMPVRQLSPALAPPGARIATVTAKTTALRATSGRVAMQVSYATRLPVLSATAGEVRVWSPDGALLVAASDVEVRAAEEPARAPTAASIIADAERFLGLPYLWDGSSAFGFDCSGITYTVFRTHGILLPRDSFAQAKAGRAVARADLRPGDLVFFATKGTVHHVGIYLGGGTMLHAPRTGRSVETISLSTPAYASEYAGARRFVG